MKSSSIRNLAKAKGLLGNNYQVILALALASLTIVVVYRNDLSIIANEALQSEAYSYVLLLPFFAAYLFYLKKDTIKGALALDRRIKTLRPNYLNELIGVALCLMAFILYWYGSNTFYPLEYHVASLPLFIMGIAVICLNLHSAKALIFPILFLLFLVPIPATFLYAVGGVMSNFNTEIAYGILKTVGLPITMSTAYGTPTLLLLDAAGKPVSFAVELACSGIYSLTAYAIIGAFLALITYTTVIKKISIFIIGFFISALLNLIRIITVVSAGYLLGEQTALLLHSIEGIILTFVGMLLVLVFSVKILKIQITLKPQPPKPCPACSIAQRKAVDFCTNCGAFLQKSLPPISKATYAKLLLLLLGCSLVALSVSTSTFTTANGQIELTTNTSTQNATNVFPAIPNYTLSFLYRDTAYEQVAQQDASLMYAYYPQNTTDSIIYVDLGVSGSISNLHNWEVCLIAYQITQGLSPLVNALDSRDTQLLKDPPLIAQCLVFDSPKGYRQVTLYWYEKAAFNTGLTVEQKYVRISLIILTDNSTDYGSLEQELQATGQQIAVKWEPSAAQALISLAVPAQQALLVALVVIVAVTASAQQMVQRRKTSNNLKLFNKFASHKEKLVLQVVLETAKQNQRITTNDILHNLQIRVGKPINQKRALSILKTLEKNGFITRRVISVNDIPKLVWRVSALSKP